MMMSMKLKSSSSLPDFDSATSRYIKVILHLGHIYDLN